MNIPITKTQKELSAIRTALLLAVDHEGHEESRNIVRTAIRRIEILGERLAGNAAELGRIGGQKTAERGPNYFRKIAAMRKTKAGGRPKKSTG